MQDYAIFCFSIIPSGTNAPDLSSRDLKDVLRLKALKSLSMLLCAYGLDHPISCSDWVFVKACSVEEIKWRFWY